MPSRSQLGKHHDSIPLVGQGQQLQTQTFIAEAEARLEYGSIEIKKVHGRITDVFVHSHYKALD